MTETGGVLVDVLFNGSITYMPTSGIAISNTESTTTIINVSLDPKPPVYVENDVLVYNLALMEFRRLYPFVLDGEEFLLEKREGNIVRVYEVTE